MKRQLLKNNFSQNQEANLVTSRAHRQFKPTAKYAEMLKGSSSHNSSIRSGGKQKLQMADSLKSDTAAAPSSSSFRSKHNSIKGRLQSQQELIKVGDDNDEGSDISKIEIGSKVYSSAKKSPNSKSDLVSPLSLSPSKDLDGVRAAQKNLNIPKSENPESTEKAIQIDSSNALDTFIIIETKDGVSSEKIPISHFLKKIVVDVNSGTVKVDLSELLGGVRKPLDGANDGPGTNSLSLTDDLSNNEIELDGAAGNTLAVEKLVRKRGRPRKNTDSFTSSAQAKAVESSSIKKLNDTENIYSTPIELSYVKEKSDSSHQLRKSTRTPAKNSRFGSDFISSKTPGKMSTSSSTWNTQLMTLAIAAEAYKDKPAKLSNRVIGVSKKQDCDKVKKGNRKQYFDKSNQDEASEYVKNQDQSVACNSLQSSNVEVGKSGKLPGTIERYKLSENLRSSLKEAFKLAVQATNDLVATAAEESQNSSISYYTLMEPKTGMVNQRLLIGHSEQGLKFKNVVFINNNLENDKEPHSLQKYFSCDLCTDIFTSTYGWLNHNKRLHNRTIATLERSLYGASRKQSYHCQLCDQKFPFQFMLDIHMQRKRHSGVSTFRCSLCKELFASHKSMEEHSLMCHPERSCEFCSKEFNSVIALKKHIQNGCLASQKINHKNGNKNDLLGLSVQSSSSKDDDLFSDCEGRSEIGSEDEFFQKQEFEADVSDDSLSSVNVVKSESGKVNCDQCLAEFSTYSGLWYHRLEEHEEFYPSGYKEKLKHKLEKTTSFLQNAHLNDQLKSIENNKNIFLVIVRPKWPQNKSKLLCTVDKRGFHFKPDDGSAHNPEDGTPPNDSSSKETSFKCASCGEMFPSASSYRDHRSREHGECFEVQRLLGAFQCTLCSNSFPCQFMLDSHVKKHGERKPLYCTLCGLYFQNIQERRQHWKTVHPGIGCPNCGKMYASIAYLQKHISLNCQDHYPPTKKFLEFQMQQLSDFDMPRQEWKVEKRLIQCHLCSKLCGSVHGWRRHMSENHEDTGFSKLSNTCIICNEVVYGYKALEKHLLETHAMESGLPIDEEENMVEEALRKCNVDIAAYKHAGKNNSDIHMDEKGIYHCPSCPKIHYSLRGMRLHVKIHVNMKLECSICQKTFKNPTLLKMHVQRHRKDAVYSCESCKKMFLTLQKLNKHRKVHHSQYDFVCDLCGVAFALNDYLQKHKLSHTDKRPHICGVCGKKFRTKPELRVHANVHTREMPYKCEICGRGFSQKGNYRIHLAQHTGAKPYQCNKCEMSFALLCHLKRHILNHDQKIQYRCIWCDKECTQRRHIQSHVQRVHKEDFNRYEQLMKLDYPVPISPSQEKLYNRRSGRNDKIRKQYRSQAQKSDSSIQQLVNVLVVKAESSEEVMSQDIVIEPTVESVMETVPEVEGFEVLIRDDHHYAKHNSLPGELMGHDSPDVRIVVCEDDKISFIIKDEGNLHLTSQESLMQLEGGEVEVPQSLQQVVDAMVSQEYAQ